MVFYTFLLICIRNRIHCNYFTTWMKKINCARKLCLHLTLLPLISSGLVAACMVCLFIIINAMPKTHWYLGCTAVCYTCMIIVVLFGRLHIDRLWLDFDKLKKELVILAQDKYRLYSLEALSKLTGTIVDQFAPPLACYACVVHCTYAD